MSFFKSFIYTYRILFLALLLFTIIAGASACGSSGGVWDVSTWDNATWQS